MRARWLVVLATAALLVVVPVAVRARPVTPSDLTAVALAARVEASAAVPWSGDVETSGALQVPDSDSFAGLADLLGQDLELRVWWRAGDDWRVDQVRGTGEADLFRNGRTSVRWVFESERATVSPVSQIRLPDASDLVPPTLARGLLQDAAASELTRLPVRRVAGVEAPGLRLTPASRATTVGHADVWVDPGTGLPLRVELSGAGDRRPVLTTALVDLVRARPDATTTRFRTGAGVRIDYDPSVDVAAAANASYPFALPGTVGGLTRRPTGTPGAVGVYGRGATRMLVLPLRGQVAGPLRDRLRSSPAAQETDAGTVLAAGPVTVLVTPGRAGRPGGGFLLTGTVTAATLERAAADLRGVVG